MKGSPFTVMVSPGEVFGRRSNAWGKVLSSGNTTAGLASNITVRARDVVGNALWEGGSALDVYAFHLGTEVQCRKFQAANMRTSGVADGAVDVGFSSYLANSSELKSC